MALNQKDTDFFRPMWRRVVVTALMAAWFGYETLFSHDTTWIVITAIGLVYCVWNLFLRYPQDETVAAPPGSTGDGTGPVAPSGSPDTPPSATPPTAPKA